MRVFISHSSKNARVAGRLGDDLAGSKFKVWLDRDQLRTGDPLLDKLQEALDASSHLLLLWSKPASDSRYVKAEWQAAYDLEKEIIPCLLDPTPLPIFLRRAIFCDLQPSYSKGLGQITAALRAKAPFAVVEPRVRQPRPAPDKQATILRLYDGQKQLLDTLNAGDVAKARRMQTALDPITKDALRRWRTDEIILNLAGYHLKNAYQLKFWDKLSGEKSPSDPILSKAEQLFHAALAIQPDDLSAKNGLGNIYWLRKNLDAAEFFVKHAIEKARRQGVRYPEAESDLKGIQEEKARRARQQAG